MTRGTKGQRQVIKKKKKNREQKGGRGEEGRSGGSWQAANQTQVVWSLSVSGGGCTGKREGPKGISRERKVLELQKWTKQNRQAF